LKIINYYLNNLLRPLIIKDNLPYYFKLKY
jgi:hypothetical protein